MALRLLFLCLLCIIFYGEAYTQHFKYKHFDVDDGLPSSQVFCAFQDTDGYMWFTTDNGLSRFNGYKFENYSTKDGITDNTILAGETTKNGSLLFFTLSSGFFWYKQGKFQPIKSKDHDKLISHHKLKIRNYVLDQKNTIWFSTNESATYYSLDTTGKIAKYKCYISNKEKYGTFLIQVDDNNILPVIKFKKTKPSITDYKVTINQEAPFIPNIVIKFTIVQQGSFMLLPSKKVSIKNSPLFYSTKKGLIEPPFSLNKKQYCTTSLLDNENNRWLGLEKGVYFYEKNSSTPIHLLPNEYVTHIFQDFEKNIWISTKDNGVYLITGRKIKNYLNTEKVISFSDYNNKLWVTTITGKVFQTDTSGYFIKVFDKKVSNIISASHFSKRGIFFYDGIYDFSGKKKETFRRKKINAKKIIAIKDSVYIVGTHNGLIYINTNIKLPSWHFKPELRINALLEDTANTVLLGTVKGLFSFNLSTLTNSDLRDGKKLLSARIMDIEKWGEKYILATKGRGLVIYSKDTLYSITKDNGLKSNLISCATVVNDSVIWIGSNKGVARIEINPITLQTKNISSYTHTEGLSSNEVIDIMHYKESIWVGTSRGISQLPLNSNNIFSITPKLKITQVYINNKLRALAQNLSLKPHENNIFINYLGVSFKTIGKLTYRYRLKGYINDWTETESRNVNFTNIPAGSYIFELQAQNKNGIWSPSKVVSFSIAKHYTQELWFIVLIIITAISIPSSIIFIYSKNRRVQEKQKRKAIEAQLLALRNQINPHFIFNALNSIQAYNVKTRDKEAIKYLSNFSELMRQILENTKHSFINLYDEISCIKNYLKLESLRTNGRFTYTITLSNELEALYIYLPPMLIQPHLENAIWKGFTNEITNPHLNIIINKQNDKLIIKIIDNGIGITKGRIASTKTTQKRGYASTGIKNILERVDSIKKLYGIDISINIFDISELETDQTGTEVCYTITLLKELPKSI